MGLRAKVLRGGIYLALRQGLGVAISVVGVILLTRTIGPGAYGIYAAALGVYSFLVMGGEWGVNVYLIRRKEEPLPQDYHQAFSLLLLLSVVGAGAAILALPLLERWVRLEDFGPVAIVLVASLPINLLQIVPLARLERALDYRRVAQTELLGQITLYTVALPLAYAGLGPWAPVGGMWAQQLLTLVLFFGVSGYRPRLHWEPARVRAMLRYGLGLSASDWLWESRRLVNPLVVGRYAGAEAVGFVALAVRLAELLSFIFMATFQRLSLPAFARLQTNRDRLAKAVDEGTSLQLMLVGPPLVGFGLVGPWVLPLFFGSRWTPVLEVYPYIAAGYLGGAMFNLHASALYVLRRIWEVAIFHLVHLALFAGSALLLVPQLGVTGYGWAELVALPGYLLLLIWFHVYVGSPISARAGIWFAAWAVPLFSWQLGAWALASVIVPLMWPATRRELLQTATMVLTKVRTP